jgi:hypothetical protein
MSPRVASKVLSQRSAEKVGYLEAKRNNPSIAAAATGA